MIGPEEAVRQEFIRILIDDYAYRESEIEIEFPIPRGSKRKDRADIVVFRGAGRDPAANVVGIVETKKPGEQSGKDQLKSYLTATSAVWGVWTNGSDIEYYCKPPGQSAIYTDRLNNIPIRGQRLEDVGKLAREDLEPYSGTMLKASFRRILNTLYANTTISRREKLGNEMIKLIFAKIRDETTYVDDPPSFYAGYREDPARVKDRVDDLFQDVVDEYRDDGLFEPHDKITLDAKGVAWAVGQLERGSLMDTPTDVVGDAFEVFAESKFVGEKGEFFTPRGVIDVAVKLVAPQPDETVCDPACGSGGFLIATMRTMWSSMARSRKWGKLSPNRLQTAQQHMAARCFFGIDKENDLVRIAKAYMAISGDGRSNVVHENSLHRARDFSPEARTKFVQHDAFRQFDCVMTNPPYGTKTKVLEEDSAHFDLGHKWTRDSKGQWKKGKPTESNPYILFVERCLDMLKDGGRLAIVLPETAFHAPTMEYLRDYIASKGRVLAVIDLPHNTFRPHCNAKTCLVVLRKGRPARANEPVVMAEAIQMGHDHQGKEMYVPGTKEVWNDLPHVLRELGDPDAAKNQFVFTVPWREIESAGHLIPRYFASRRPPRTRRGRKWVVLGGLVDDGVIGAWDGHGSPSAAEKGRGDVPYIRVSDIVNWELYRNPTTGVTEETYRRFTKNRHPVQAEDVIFVRRGSYRIGTVAMASPRDTRIVMTRELVTFRVAPENDLGVTPYYLLGLLSSSHVQEQIRRLTFIDTTLPNIGDRWRELRLPFHRKPADMQQMGNSVRRAIRRKWSAQDDIDKLRSDFGGIVT
ncbi:MAG: N-6 DNA methylase [Chloroflexota bacterium]|nr:N-6 DNA methylase [Chloroflexota bacterium]